MRSRIRRQPALPLLASEFGESTLHQQGSGEYDPLFLITKLGAKVNRVIVAGLLERLEPRETANGATIWQGQIRDPSGTHYFSVGDYAPESMRELTVQLSSRIDDGEVIMLMMTAKARYFQTDEGAVYTSLRPEEAAVISRTVYREWLVRAAKGMLTRIDAHEKSINSEKSIDSLAKAGVPENLIEGLLLAGEHYGEIDTESYRLNILQTLDIAEDKEVSITPVVQAQKSLVVEESQSEDKEPAKENQEGDINSAILDLVKRLDKGEGVDFDTVLNNASARGYDRDAAEAALDELSEDGEIHEPRFGWFKLTE
ncbi:MAG: hypothetical protein CMA91_01170 [Euryarchaeota archaeon]|nr:hypothetical protein [Euryarchaeota archaeon]|tara:strand:- start:2149 stop:3087 length:939 start_codon:yes stop_codon:yes gene_type:complete